MTNILSLINAGKNIADAKGRILKVFYKKFMFLAISLSLFAIPSVVQAQSLTWSGVAETNLRDLNYTDMACNYVFGSVRNVYIIAQDNAAGTTLISARYDFRCGDNASSDTVYMSFANGGSTRTCHAYAFYNKQCTLYGQKIDG